MFNVFLPRGGVKQEGAAYVCRRMKAFGVGVAHRYVLIFSAWPYIHLRVDSTLLRGVWRVRVWLSSGA